ncbi:hypothetical protein ABIB40_002545 [Pedobacter sp. UYP30]
MLTILEETKGDLGWRKKMSRPDDFVYETI